MFRILAILIVAGGVWLFWNKEKQSAEAPTASSLPAQESSSTKEMIVTQEPEVQEITLKMNNWYFEPEEIRVKEGTRVRFLLQNVSGTHAFSLPDFNVKSQTLEAGTSDTVEFVADKKGTFPFRCSVYCGEGHSGMKGTLIVE